MIRFLKQLSLALGLAALSLCIAGAADSAQETIATEATQTISAAPTSQASNTSKTLQDFSYIEFHNIEVLVIQSDVSVDELNASKDNVGSGTICCFDETGKNIYDGTLKSIKGRGNTSWGMAENQKPYNIKLDKKGELIPGAVASKKYCLLCGLSYVQTAKDIWVGENSVLATLTGFKFYEDVGGNYPIKATPVELYINGDYRGVYVLCEAIQIGEGRVDITETDYAIEGETYKDEKVKLSSNGKIFETEIRYSPETELNGNTGGFILEFDFISSNKEDCYFITAKGNTYYFKDPDMPSKDQVLKIAQYIQDFEDAVYSDTGYNTQGKYYADYYDIESNSIELAVKYISTDGDIYRKSTYFAIDTDGSGAFKKIESGPAWDFDSCNFGKSTNYTASVTQLMDRTLLCNVFFHDDFLSAVDENLTGKFKTVMDSYASSGGYIEQLIAKLGPAMAANLERWPDSMNFGADENTSHSAKSFIKNYRYHIERFYDEIWTDSFNADLRERMRQAIEKVESFRDGMYSLCFSDVAIDAYYHDAVTWSLRNFVCQGTGDNKFLPKSKCTRAQVLTMLHRAYSTPAPGSDDSVTLIGGMPDAYYYNATCWWASILGESGMYVPYEKESDGTYKLNPDAPITRAEFIYYIWVVDGCPEVSASNVENFADIAADAYYAKAALWARAEGISNGTGNNMFSPDATITRADTLCLIWRYK